MYLPSFENATIRQLVIFQNGKVSLLFSFTISNLINYYHFKVMVRWFAFYILKSSHLTLTKCLAIIIRCSTPHKQTFKENMHNTYTNRYYTIVVHMSFSIRCLNFIIHYLTNVLLTLKCPIHFQSFH